MLRKGSYVGISGVIRLSISVVSVPILISIIGTEEYGIWSFSYATISLLVFLEAGFSNTTTVFLSRAVAGNRSKEVESVLASLFVFILALACIAFVSVLGTTYQFSDYFSEILDGTEVHRIFLFGAVAIWCRLVQQLFIGVLQAYESYKTFGILNSLQGAGTSLGMLLIASMGGKTVELMLWHAIHNLFFLAVYFFASYGRINVLTKICAVNTAKLKEIFRYMLPLWFSSIGMVLFAQGDRLIVASLFTNEKLGVYSAITDICRQINSVSALPIRPLISDLSKKAAKIEEYKFSSVINQDRYSTLLSVSRFSTQINAISIFCLSSIMLALIPVAKEMMFSSSSLANQSYLISLFVGILIYSAYSLNAPGYYILLAFGEVKRISCIVTVSSGLSLFLIYLLGSRFGLLGSISGNIGFLLTLLLCGFSMNKIGQNSLSWLSWIKTPTATFFLLLVISLILQVRQVENASLFGGLATLVLIFINLFWILLEHKKYLRNSIPEIVH